MRPPKPTLRNGHRVTTIPLVMCPVLEPVADVRAPMRHLPAVLLVGIALVGCAGCQSASQPSREPTVAAAALPKTDRAKLMAAKEFFYAAVAGDRPALARARQALNELGGGESSDPEVIGYLGACELLQAARAVLPWDKANLARDGLALEDRAVAEAPQDLEVRFLRGVTNYQLPRFMGRWNQATHDLATVAAVAEREAATGRLDRRAAAADLDYHGKVLEESYDAIGAIDAWRAASRVDADSPGGRDALKHLAEHNASP